jgi:hypothetical protein
MGVLGSMRGLSCARDAVKATSSPFSWLLKGTAVCGVRLSVVMVTGRQKREVSLVKVVKASCSSGVTIVVGWSERVCA